MRLSRSRGTKENQPVNSGIQNILYIAPTARYFHIFPSVGCLTVADKREQMFAFSLNLA
jgi:hypothetical protein